MKKVKLYANSFTDEKNTAHRLEYFLLIRSAEQGKIYGIEITKTDAAGNMEKDAVEGDVYKRQEQALLRTAKKRPDLLKTAELTKKDLKFLQEQGIEIEK